MIKKNYGCFLKGGNAVDTIALLVALIFFVLGFAGTLLPLLPGAPLIWGGMLVYGILTNFSNLDMQFFIFQGIIVLLIFLIDYVAGAWGAERYGGSKAAIVGSIVGGLFGLFIMGPAGIIIGPFIGAMVAELLKGNSFEKSLKVGWGTIIGFLGGTLLKFILEIVMVIWFFIAI